MGLLNPYAGLLGPDAMGFAQGQGLLGMGASLLAAGGPSPRPVGLGQALGQGLQGGLSQYLGAAQMGVQADQMRRDRDREDWMRDLQERQYGLQEQAFGLEQQEFEREQEIRDQLFGGGMSGAGIDNPFALAAALDGDYGPAATAYANTPGTYGGPPGAATGQPVPLVPPGVPPAAEPLLPPDQRAEAPAQPIGDSIYGAAVAMVPPAYRAEFESMIGAGPGADGETYDEWAQMVTAMARDRFDMDWVQTQQFRDQLDNEWDRLNGQPAPSATPPVAGTPTPQGIPTGAAFDRQSGEYLTVRGPDGRDWYAARDQSGALIPLAPMPRASDEQREVDAETRAAANELRDEYVRQTQDYVEAEAQYKAMQRYAAEGTAQSDVALIFAFFKAIDPNSTVRESEFAMAADSMGLPEQMVQGVQQLLNGERLGDEVRRAFVRAAGQSFGQRQAQAAEVAAAYRAMAEEMGVPPEWVVTFDPSRTIVPTDDAAIDAIRQRYGLE